MSAAGIETGTPITGGQEASVMKLENATNESVLYTNRIATMNLLLKKSIILEVGGWDGTYLINMTLIWGTELAPKAIESLMSPMPCVIILTDLH